MKKTALFLFLFAFSRSSAEITKITPLVGTSGFEILKTSFVKLVDESYPKDITQFYKSNRIFIAKTYTEYEIDQDEYIRNEENYYLFENQKDIERIIIYASQKSNKVQCYYIDKDWQ